MLATKAPMFMLFAACWRKLSPMKRNEKPKINSPMLFFLELFEKMSGMPKASRGMAKAAMLILNPMAEMTHAVTVVPMLAPMMTPIAWVRFINPALTNETIMTVVALELWIRAVTKMPVSTPITRFLVIEASTVLNRSPANFSSPSLIIFIP